MDYGIQKGNIYHLLLTQMQIGQVVLMTDGIMAKKETIIDIYIYSRGRVYCSNNMLYTGSLDETNFDIYTG